MAIHKSLSKLISDKEFNHVVIGYSGGVDSSVLLYLIIKNSIIRSKKITAIHINHSLSKNSDDWESFCRENCKNLGIEFKSYKIKYSKKENDSFEEFSRKKRNMFFEKNLDKKSILFTAHHLDDQIETFIFNAIRGSGLDGLSGIKIEKKLKKGTHLRPLINITKDEIYNFAKNYNIKFIEDESNSTDFYSRNYIRNRIIPLIKNYWPSYSKTLKRTIYNINKGSKLNKDLALIDSNYKDNKLNKLNFSNIENLPEDRIENIIRHWVTSNGFYSPSEKQLKNIVSTFFYSGKDKNPIFICKHYEIKRYKNELFLEKPNKFKVTSKLFNWTKGEDLYIPEMKLRVTWSELVEHTGNELNHNVTAKFRSGGEKILKNGVNKSLKDVLREDGIPPWDRNKILLIYKKEQLIAYWKVI